ncbi:HhoA/HhoB/HtrA family serine endopeptidase [Chroococcidiopsis sp.]|uniref:HhoA/HhoB/HtrA family serine endopeptidase n=1 Tax=Chroococcidiopsis sp. TaxID=3088168 RepID=UPI003F34320C
MSIKQRDANKNLEQTKSHLQSNHAIHHQAKKNLVQQPVTRFALFLLGTAATILGIYAIARHFSWWQLPYTSIAVIPTEAAQASLPPNINTNFVTAVVDRVGPAVVRIDAAKTVTNRLPDAFNDPFFRDFFGSQVPQPGRRTIRGAGSGFIISPNGRILTNAHVVDGADTVKVRLKDGRSFEGKVLGADPVTDVAVVQIQAQQLPTVKFGNSQQLQPGQWAIAIGNPLGLDNTVTTGIVSATGRSSSDVGIPDKRVNFIQTDAAINPGNSGGPLLNQQGEVIGMNTAIIGGAQGLGFAIPIHTAQRIADQLVARGRVEHAFLGIQMLTLTPEVKQQIASDPNSWLNVDEDRGVLVVRVVPDSPAAKAGLRVGDVIHKLNGQSVTEADAIRQAVENSAIGKDIRLELRRQGRTLNLAVRPGAFPTAQVE